MKYKFIPFGRCEWSVGPGLCGKRAVGKVIGSNNRESLICSQHLRYLVKKGLTSERA